MGGCVSISSGSSKGDETSPSPAGLCIDIFGCRWRRKASSNHGMNLQRLSWAAPNRILSNGRTSNSCIFTQQGRKGINQDAMIVWEDFMAEGVTFCGVFDGHGPHGHLVARKVRDALPLKLSSFLTSSESRRNGSGLNCCNVDARSDVVDPTKEDSSVESLWREAFLNSYKAMDKELKSNRNLDCFCSGTTAVTLVKQGSNILMGNIGDSRAVLGSKDSNDSLISTQLTVDLKPDLPREADRIKRCKGRVFALQDEPEVPRVWLPFDDAPGLAMARAFGDFCLKEYGVISIPEFSLHKLTAQDKFIVLASDGVWDVLSNEEVVEIVWSAPARSSAARVVVESAAREWRSKYPTSKMDDCAVVCFFLDGKMDGVETEHQSISISSAAESEPCLTRNYTVRSSSDDQSWSGLQGVSRVNSLVQLPRFSGP